MAVKIAHASMDERGKASGGAIGDQTKKEICIRDWYNKDWDCVIRFKKEKHAEKAAAFMEQLAKNDNVGYDQSNRNSLIIQAEKVDWQADKIKTKCEADCSSSITAAAIAAGVKKADVFTSNNACTTATLKSKLLKTGLVEVFTNKAQTQTDKFALRGDIYLKEGSHVVMVIEDSPSATKRENESAEEDNTKKIKKIQNWLNKEYGFKLEVNGKSNAKTLKALIKALQIEVGIAVTGEFDSKLKTKLPVLEKGSTGNIVTIWQSYLVLFDIDPKGVDGVFGEGCEKGTKKYQKSVGIKVDGQVGSNTWAKAFK